MVAERESQGLEVCNGSLRFQTPRKEKALVAESESVVIVMKSHLMESFG